MIELYIPGTPIAMPRAKAFRRANHVGHYTPDNGIVAYRAAIALACSQFKQTPLLCGPVQVDTAYLFDRHATRVWKTKEMDRYWHITRPDIDNLDKAVYDSITQSGFIWDDDTRVCCGEHWKRHCAGDESSGTFVTITELDST